MLIYAIVEASRRSEGMALSFWRLTAAAYALWFVAQSLGVYYDLTASSTVLWIEQPPVLFLVRSPGHGLVP